VRLKEIIQFGDLLNNEESNIKEDQNKLMRQGELGPFDPG